MEVYLDLQSDLLADVLSVEHLVADFTLEAAQVPVLVQCHKWLFIFKLLSTAATICKERKNTKIRWYFLCVEKFFDLTELKGKRNTGFMF